MAKAALLGRLGVGELLLKALEAGNRAPHQLRHPGSGAGIGLEGVEGLAEAGGQGLAVASPGLSSRLKPRATRSGSLAGEGQIRIAARGSRSQSW